MKDPCKAQQSKPTNLGWALQGVCVFLFAAGFLAEQAGWIRFESSWMYPALLAVMGAAFILEGVVSRRLPPVTKAGQDAPPNGGPAKSSGNSGGSQAPPLVS